ncbi:MAG: phosphatidate cytidylyltransferase [Lachnospiraceae bacterium]|nr:phosphatidate cytidylyltransferase [Lachnospiraceae bacterium]
MFWTRLISGAVLLIIAAASFAIGGPVLAGLLLVISLIAYWELCKATGALTEGKWNGLTAVGSAGILAYYGAVYFLDDASFQLMVIMGVALFSMFVYVGKFPKYSCQQVVASFFSFVYAPVMFAFMYLTRETEYGLYLVWLILICSWGCDTCAYVVGMLIGKHKIFPVLSPKKSLEGCIGGVVGAMIIGAIYSHFLVNQVVQNQNVTWVIVLISGVGAVMSQVGDLAASAIKRQQGIKDYGKLIPGHGGIMDRFDSVIVTAPMIYFLSMILIHGLQK